MTFNFTFNRLNLSIACNMICNTYFAIETSTNRRFQTPFFGEYSIIKWIYGECTEDLHPRIIRFLGSNPASVENQAENSTRAEFLLCARASLKKPETFLLRVNGSACPVDACSPKRRYFVSMTTLCGSDHARNPLKRKIRACQTSN